MWLEGVMLAYQIFPRWNQQDNPILSRNKMNHTQIPLFLNVVLFSLQQQLIDSQMQENDWQVTKKVDSWFHSLYLINSFSSA